MVSVVLAGIECLDGVFGVWGLTRAVCVYSYSLSYTMLVAVSSAAGAIVLMS